MVGVVSHEYYQEKSNTMSHKWFQYNGLAVFAVGCHVLNACSWIFRLTGIWFLWGSCCWKLLLAGGFKAYLLMCYQWWLLLEMAGCWWVQSMPTRVLSCNVVFQDSGRIGHVPSMSALSWCIITSRCAPTGSCPWVTPSHGPTGQLTSL